MLFTVISKKSLTNPISSTFSSKSFVVLARMFRSLIHFELIFVHSVRQGSKFIHLSICIFPIVVYQENCLFTHWMVLTHLLKIIWLFMGGFISGLSILFHWSMHSSLCQYHTVSINVVKFWNQEVWDFQLCSSSRLFWLLRAPWYSMWALGWIFLGLKKLLLGFW